MKLKMKTYLKQGGERLLVSEYEAPYFMFDEMRLLKTLCSSSDVVASEAKIGDSVFSKVYYLSKNAMGCLNKEMNKRAVKPEKIKFPCDEFMSRYENTSARRVNGFGIATEISEVVSLTSTLTRLATYIPGKTNMNFEINFVEEG